MTQARRSILSVPANVEKFHKKAYDSEVDVIMFDLEDSIPVEKKSEARIQAAEALNRSKSDKILTYRINQVGSEFAADDLVEVISKAGEKIYSIVIPKVDNAGDIHFVDRMLDTLESKYARKNQIKIEASIESVKGMENISSIAASSKRLLSLVFGIADFTSSLGASLVSISGHGENEESIYPGHRWHYAMSRIAIAAKANDLLAIDAPYGNFRDNEALERSCRMARAIGIDGKWAIHPDQIDTINKIFSPQKDEIENAVKILNAAEKASILGKGSAQIEGRMIDGATLRLAEKTYNAAKNFGLV